MCTVARQGYKLQTKITKYKTVCWYLMVQFRWYLKIRYVTSQHDQLITYAACIKRILDLATFYSLVILCHLRYKDMPEPFKEVWYGPSGF